MLSSKAIWLPELIDDGNENYDDDEDEQQRRKLQQSNTIPINIT